MINLSNQPKPHSCEDSLEQIYPAHMQAQPGTKWTCPGCGLSYVHVCSEAEGCWWELAGDCVV